MSTEEIVTTTPVITTPPAPPVEDEPKEPILGDSVPKIVVKDKDDDGNALSEEEKATLYNRAAADSALENSVKIRVDNTVNNYLSNHPEYAPFADRIRSFVTHPNRFSMIKSGLPVETVIIEAIGTKNIMKIGAELATKSQTDADATLNKGGNRPTPPTAVATDVKKMPITDFTKLRDQVNQGFIKR